jgi:hypothetical protein
VLDQRGRLLIAALGFAGLPRPSYDHALWTLRTWLDSLVRHRPHHRGDAPPGLRPAVTQYDERGWRATFYTTEMEHSPTSATGTAWEPTPWHATQQAAWEALRQVDLAGRLTVRYPRP